MSDLTICMPSNRSLDASFRSIETAVAYCEARDARLIVSDNSGDDEKRKYWMNRSPVIDWHLNPGTSAGENFLFTIRKASTPFMMMQGDDDEILYRSSYLPLELSELQAGDVGVRPVTEVFATGLGTLQTHDYALEAETPQGRVLDYSSLAKGNNSAFYSIFRTEVYRDLMEFFYRHHPTRGDYCDWALQMALVAYGKLVHDPSTVFRYNVDQWTTEEKIEARKSLIYQRAGLPEGSDRHHPLLLMLDTYVLACRPGTMLSEQERVDVAALLTGSFLATYLRQVEASPADYTATTRYLVERCHEETTVSNRFFLALMMADQILPGLKDRYVAFYQAGEKWPAERSAAGL